jgi:hypothetical protein
MRRARTGLARLREGRLGRDGRLGLPGLFGRDETETLPSAAT